MKVCIAVDDTKIAENAFDCEFKLEDVAITILKFTTEQYTDRQMSSSFVMCPSAEVIWKVLDTLYNFFTVHAHQIAKL